MLKSGGPVKHFALAFVLAIILYAVCYTAIEHRRTRLGPWRVLFVQTPGGVPTLVINEPKLNLATVKLTFPNNSSATTNLLLVTAIPQPVPFSVPFGKCLFMDTTFQPGTLVFNLFGHEVQLLPRTLTIDRREYPWSSESTLAITNAPILPDPFSTTDTFPAAR